ncbi:MAG: 4-hydroxybenzoate octaprenyltransferase [Rhodospirillales bacterium]|nr:4-hydroxybenzoate octaprenyltransferase [Rhodospirillales bacterium]
MTPSAATAHTDIRAAGWVARLPGRLRPYALLARIDRPIGAWLLYMPGLWAIALGARGQRMVSLALLFLIGSFVMRAAGCVVNDLWDRDLDRRVARTAARPLAAGTVAPLGALIFLALLCAVGLAVLLVLPRLAWLVGVASLPLVALYPLAKRVTWWPQAVLGLTFSWAAPVGAAAAHVALAPALVLYAAAFFWILGYDTIYAHQDREDDALVGVRSTARLFGERSRAFIALVYAAMVALLVLAGLLAGLSPAYDVALVLPALLLAWQVVRLDVNDPALCLALFKANRNTGLLVALAILVGRS